MGKTNVKAGDKIRIVKAFLAGDYYKNGDVLTVKSVDSDDGMVHVVEHSRVIAVEEFEVIEQPKFKEGDKVRGKLTGRKYTLTSRMPERDGSIHGLAWKTTEGFGWIGENQIELLEEPLEKGDKVTLLNGGGKYPLNGYENGKEYELESVSYVHHTYGSPCVELTGGSAAHGFASRDMLKKVVEESSMIEEESELKVGAYAEVRLGHGDSNIGGGDVVKITGEGIMYDFHVKRISGVETSAFDEEDLVQISEKEALEAVAPKADFEVGERAVLKSVRGALTGFTAGEEVEITSKDTPVYDALQVESVRNRGLKGYVGIREQHDFLSKVSPQAKFKVGDRVEMRNTEGYILRDNQRTGEIVGILNHPEGFRYSINIDNYDGSYLGFFEDGLRLVANPKPAEGDIVVIIGNTNFSRNKVGDIGKVSSISSSRGARVDVPSRPDSDEVNGNFTKYSEMRLATTEEREQYEKEADADKLKKGDLVKLTVAEGKNPEHGWGAVKNGEVGTVTDVMGEEVVVDFTSQSDWSAKSFELTKLSEVEAEDEAKRKAQAEKLAEIGRKPGELKAGDIVKVVSEVSGHPVGTIGEMQGSRLMQANGETYAHSSAELITPVELRFDRM